MSGYVAAGLSAFCNGSFAIIFKTRCVAQAQLSPIVFQLYLSIGVFLSSLLTIPFLAYNPDITQDDSGTRLVFAPLALVAGILFVLSAVFSFLAMSQVGIALGQGIWGGVAIITSFSWGVLVFGDEAETFLAIWSIALLLLGVVGIAFCQELAELALFSKNKAFVMSRTATPGADDKKTPLMLDMAEGDATSTEGDVTSTDSGKQHHAFGVACAIAVGLCGGSTLVPLHYMPSSQSGLVFMPTFGLGAMIASPCACAIWFAATKKIPDLKMKETLGPGIVSGIIWNAGNLLSIYAIPRIGFAVAQPLLQCALLVAGVWGIFFFGEIPHPRSQAIFCCSGLLLIGGAVLLSLSSSS